MDDCVAVFDNDLGEDNLRESFARGRSSTCNQSSELSQSRFSKHFSDL